MGTDHPYAAGPGSVSALPLRVEDGDGSATQLAERDDFARVDRGFAAVFPELAGLAPTAVEAVAVEVAAGWADRVRFPVAFVGGDVWLLAVLPELFGAVVLVLAPDVGAGRWPGDCTAAGVRLTSPTVDDAGLVTVRRVRSATDSAAMPA